MFWQQNKDSTDQAFFGLAKLELQLKIENDFVDQCFKKVIISSIINKGNYYQSFINGG